MDTKYELTHKLTLEKKILQPPLRDSNSKPFKYEAGALTNNLSQLPNTHVHPFPLNVNKLENSVSKFIILVPSSKLTEKKERFQ